MDDMPAIQYAKSGNVHIAYMSAGEGPEEVLITPGATSHVAGYWASPWLQDLIPRARVTWFDKRGTGASDRGANFTFEERIDDLRAVMDAAGISAAHLVGLSEGGPMSILFAAMFPDRARSLTIYGSFPAWMRKADYPHGMNLSLSEYSHWVDRVEAAYMGEPDALRWMAEMFAPSRAPDPAFRSAWHTAMTVSASPGAAHALWEMLYEVDVRHVLPTIRVPTTVVHFTGDRVCPVEGGRYIAAHIPGARLVELQGSDHYYTEPFPEFSGAVLDNIARAGAEATPTKDRRLATVLFTDIVDSTPAAAQAGDRAWRETLDRHDAACRRVVGAHGGHLVKYTGDGLLATFDGPSRAVRCAAELHSALGAFGVSIRAGLHSGEIEARGDDIAGMAVHLAARVSSLAASGETLVSSTVKDLVVGAGFSFEERGEHMLKGVAEPWRLYALGA
jgi:class 3 adenylate cyclase